MNVFELFVVAVGLSMDAFAVAICIGLSMAKTNVKKALIVGLYFGVFQAVMPVIGYMVASQFAEHVTRYSHLVVFVLLSFLGMKMIWSSFKKEEYSDQEAVLKPIKMIPLALATSIDAMAVGVSFAFLYVSIVPAVSLIGVVTLVISMIGVKIGNVFGVRFKSKAELAGGLILVAMGVWVLLEHTI